MKVPKSLKKSFFNQPTLVIAQNLLGRQLLRRMPDGSLIKGIITEVEAYVGPEDKASHASRGRTKRTEIMFGPAGYWYVYLIYGMYYCLNIVTEKKDYPAAVLIRAVKGISGPGRVCRYFAVDKSFNGKPSSTISGLWIADSGLAIAEKNINYGPRIGVDYAGEWKDKPWRMWIESI